MVMNKLNLPKAINQIINGSSGESNLTAQALYAALSGEQAIARNALAKALSGVEANYGFGLVRIAEAYFYLGETEQAEKYLLQSTKSKEAYQASFGKEAAEVALLLKNEELLITIIDYAFVVQQGMPHTAVQYLLRLPFITNTNYAIKLLDICVVESWGLSAFKLAKALGQKELASQVLACMWSGNHNHSNQFAKEESVKEATVGILLWLNEEQ
jgi:hypothetical protein